MRVPSHRLDPKRFDEAKRKAGYKSDAALARAIGIDSSQMTRWRSGDTTPAGDTLANLCRALRVTPGYLFGADEEDPARRRRRLLDEVREVFGRTEADLLDTVQRLTPHHKAIVSGRISGWVEALEEMERRELLTPYDVEREQKRLSEAGEPAPEAGEREGDERAPRPEAAPPTEPPR